jgi:putative membrane protein
MSGMSGALPGWHYLPLLLVLAAAGAYGSGVLRLARRGDRWPLSRRWWFALALVSVLIGTGYPSLAEPAGFGLHAVGHLIVMMVAPLALALSAPVTLWLRASRPGLRRKTLRLMHSRPARLLTLAPVVVTLDVAGLYAYYLTPLFAAAEQQALLHLLLHLHMFLAGCLLNWFVLGRDPGPRRGGMPARLSVLLATAAAHDVMAKLMYARLLPTGAGSAEQLQAGAQILYYGGDAIELLTAAVVMTAWYRRGGRELRRQERRTGVPHVAAPSGN